MIAIDKTVPDFTLPATGGSDFQLAAALGKSLVLYFYPKDSTPGCTTEACSFRDNYQAYQTTGTVILGVSPDTVNSHVKLMENNQLNLKITVNNVAECLLRKPISNP